jgi:hypothetical protein
MNITVSLETITPEIAKEMLAKNTRNRTMNANRVSAMSSVMKSGKWPLTHQGIAISETGVLLDGQHRLSAIVMAKVSIGMYVTRGLPEESIEAIDIGEIRRAHHVLAIADGVKLTGNERSALVAAWLLATHGTMTRTGRTTIHALREAVKEHGESVRAIVGIIGGAHDRIANAAVMGTLVIAHRTKPRQAEEFSKLYRSGANLSENHPALVLRNFVVARASNAGHKWRDDISLRTIAAFDAFVRGDSRGYLKRADVAREKYLKPWRTTGSEE